MCEAKKRAAGAQPHEVMSPKKPKGPAPNDEFGKPMRWDHDKGMYVGATNWVDLVDDTVEGPCRQMVGELRLDQMCGVRNGTKVCLGTLGCKYHSVARKRMVHGRSQPFDQLMLAFHAATGAPAAREEVSQEEHVPPESALLQEKLRGLEGDLAESERRVQRLRSENEALMEQRTQSEIR
jgi:hypothetical protein